MLADVMPWICLQILLPLCVFVLCGRWKVTIADVRASCVEEVADVIATGGRWNSHVRVDLILI